MIDVDEWCKVWLDEFDPMIMGIARGHHNLFETYLDVRMKEIKCAIREKPVEMVVREKSSMRDTIVYTVHCHGDTDTCELTRYQIEEGHGRIEPGYAFTTKRIEGSSVEVSNVYESSCEEVEHDSPLLPSPDGETD